MMFLFAAISDLAWLWSDRVMTIIGLIGALTAAAFSVRNWFNTSTLFEANRLQNEERRKLEARQKAPITIRLLCTPSNSAETSSADSTRPRTLELPYKPRRDQLSRSELMGILGTYYGQERFPPKQLVETVLSNGSLNRVLAGENDLDDSDEILEIPCPPEVFQSFATYVHSEKTIGGDAGVEPTSPPRK